MMPISHKPASWMLSLLGSILASTASAQELVDLTLFPEPSTVEIGDTVTVALRASAQDDLPANIGALDALLSWDPAVLRLVDSDESGADYDWFQAGFFPDPDGINGTFADGDAIFTALAQFSTPAVAPPAPGLLVTELQFEALANSPGTAISFTPAQGNFGSTQVIDFFVAGLNITGDISSQATVIIGDLATRYCEGTPAICPCGNALVGQGCLNSTGSGAIMTASGTASVAADDLVLQVAQVPAFQFGIVYTGENQIQIPFGDGLRCVGAGPAGVIRFPITNSGATGTLQTGPNLLSNLGPSQPIGVGETWNFQGWYRDPAGPCGTAFNLSDAVAVTFLP